MRRSGVALCAWVAAMAAGAGPARADVGTASGAPRCAAAPGVPAATASTSHTVGAYTVTLFEPDDVARPQIWQGPICIRRERTVSGKQTECGLDLSLIAGMTPTADRRAIDVRIFSGSNGRTVRVSLADCKLKFLD